MASGGHGIPLVGGMGVPMNESDRRQRIISSTPRLTVDEVANRSFAKGVRGFSEPEVRAFLKRVAEELTIGRGHEAELEAAIDSLEEQLRTPRPLSEQELLDALGEETARLLRSAREASDDIRKKAEERAALLVEEANGGAERTRAEAAEVLASRVAEAETRTAELVATAERGRPRCSTPRRPKPTRSSTTRATRAARCSTRRRRRVNASSAISCGAARC